MIANAVHEQILVLLLCMLITSPVIWLVLSVLAVVFAWWRVMLVAAVFGLVAGVFWAFVGGFVLLLIAPCQVVLAFGMRRGHDVWNPPCTRKRQAHGSTSGDRYPGSRQ